MRRWQVFVIIDVLSRSRAYLDELYERLASLLEATRPKGLQAVTLDVDAALEISDGQLQSKLLDAGPAPAAVERVFRKLSLRVHPDKNPEDLDRAQMAFNRSLSLPLFLSLSFLSLSLSPCPVLYLCFGAEAPYTSFLCGSLRKTDLLWASILEKMPCIPIIPLDMAILDAFLVTCGRAKV